MVVIVSAYVTNLILVGICVSIIRALCAAAAGIGAGSRVPVISFVVRPLITESMLVCRCVTSYERKYHSHNCKHAYC